MVVGPRSQSCCSTASSASGNSGTARRIVWTPLSDSLSEESLSDMASDMSRHFCRFFFVARGWIFTMTLLPCPDCKKIMRAPWKPTRQQIAAAAGKHVPDLLAPGLDVVFCGINPGLYSGAVGHHFARPGNRFWPALHASDLTPRLFSPFEERGLLALGCGITNVLARATAAAGAFGADELREGARRLSVQVNRYR